jgi:hypothetical protein
MGLSKTMPPELPETLRVALHVIDVLEELGIRYHLGGSYASSIHGIPRHTQGIDLVVELSPSAVHPFVSRLAGDFFVNEESAREASRAKGSFNLVHLDSGFKVDIFVRGDDPFDREEFARHRPQLIRTEPDRQVFVKSPEDILLRKLQWYRLGGGLSERQWADIQGIARTQGGRLDRAYLERWAKELGVDDLLEKVLADLTE